MNTIKLWIRNWLEVQGPVSRGYLYDEIDSLYKKIGEVSEITSSWSAEDLDELDRKFDALCEFVGVEFVYEKISNGSVWADSERWYARKKKSRPKTK